MVRHRDPFPTDKERSRHYLPNKKISLSQMTGKDTFLALQTYFLCKKEIFSGPYPRSIAYKVIDTGPVTSKRGIPAKFAKNLGSTSSLRELS